jgi:predicted PolB exonuclease-like 3'-5' exonuclease
VFKYIHDKIWFFDIEWTPDPDVGRKLYQCENMTNREVIQEMWKRAGATDEKPQPFVKTALCRILSIAFLSRNTEDGQPSFSLYSLPKKPDDTEAEIIDNFLGYVGRREPQIVGFNSVQGDLKILVQRGLANEISARDFAKRPDKPWEGRDYFSDFGDFHIDLMRILGGKGKENPSLNEMAAICGFPGKIDVDGKQIAELWLENDLSQIIAYNEFDVLTTYLLWLRMAKFSGHVSEENYFEELGIFKNFLAEETSNRPHLKKFLAKWEEIEARNVQAISVPN